MRARSRSEACAGRGVHIRRRAHAGGDRVARTDGALLCGCCLGRGGVAAVQLGARRSLLRRRHRLVRRAGRRHPRGARGAHRLRRRSRHRAGDARPPPRRVPDRGVSPRAWHGGHGHRSPPAPRHHRSAAPALLGWFVSTTTETTEREQAAFARVELARHPERPRAHQVIDGVFSDWHELRGDRRFGDGRAVIAGPALLHGRTVMVIGQEKGTDPMTRAVHNFGMPHPEGYRKARRLMRQAEKFGMPVVCLIDTPAAYAGVGAEERGQAWAIADSLLCMLTLRTPTVSVVLSEGGSGGALALGVADRVLALENAVYTVAPPETCAAILYRDAGQRARAAAAMRPGVDTAHLLGLVDELVPEPEPGAHAHPEMVVAALRGALTRHLEELCRMTPDELLASRARRHRLAAG